MSKNSEYNRRGRNQSRRGSYSNRQGSWDNYSECRGRSDSGRSRSGNYHRWQPRDKRHFTTFPKFKDSSDEVRQNDNAMNSSYEEAVPMKRAYNEYTRAESERKQQDGKTRRKRKSASGGKATFSKTNSSETSIEHSKKTDSSFELETDSLERHVKPAIKGDLSSANNKKTVFSSDNDSDIEKLKAQVDILLNTKKNSPTGEAASLPPLLNKKENDNSSSSSSSSSSESSSDEQLTESRANVKKEKSSEDEVICLGNLERIENVPDDENVSNNEDTPNSIKREICILCEKKGHTSFNCFTICKNCGQRYHGLKDCPKPPNLSTVLQRLMEFCLRQCRQYNPEQRFDFNSLNGIHLQEASNKYFEANLSRQPKASSSPVRSRSSKRRSSSRESECSYKEDASKKRKRRKTNDSSAPNSFNQFPFNSAFTPQFSFGSQAMPFGAQPIAMNTILGLAQMLGLAPFNSTNSRF